MPRGCKTSPKFRTTSISYITSGICQRIQKHPQIPHYIKGWALYGAMDDRGWLSAWFRMKLCSYGNCSTAVVYFFNIFTRWDHFVSSRIWSQLKKVPFSTCAWALPRKRWKLVFPAAECVRPLSKIYLGVSPTSPGTQIQEKLPTALSWITKLGQIRSKRPIGFEKNVFFDTIYSRNHIHLIWIEKVRTVTACNRPPRWAGNTPW